MAEWIKGAMRQAAPPSRQRNADELNMHAA
jgi:hypothetical protein